MEVALVGCTTQELDSLRIVSNITKLVGTLLDAYHLFKQKFQNTIN